MLIEDKEGKLVRITSPDLFYGLALNQTSLEFEDNVR